MSKKVFELAKELDMGAIELVESLRNMGLLVRNHMAAISDADIEKAMSILRPAPISGAKEVKKTVRRKAADKDTVASSPVSKSAVVTVKRKLAKDDEKLEEAHTAQEALEVVDSAHDDHAVSAPESSDIVSEGDDVKMVDEVSAESSEPTPVDLQSSTAPTAPVSSATPSNASAAGKAVGKSEEKRILRGLRVVAMPEVKKKEIPTVSKPSSRPTSETGTSEPVDDGKPKKEYLRSEKMFSFTPIFTPPVIEKKPVPKRTDDVNALAPESEADREARDRADSKKRIGGLAAMVAKPKGKARDMILIRADEELKTYTNDLIGRVLYRQVGRKKIWDGRSDHTLVTEMKDSKRVVQIYKSTTAEELAHKLKVTFREFQAKALELNLLILAEDFFGLHLTASLSALYGYRVEDVSFDEQKALGKSPTVEVDPNAVVRDPIITIMGHVDHGKTTLLDTIRKTKVASGEAGGITQHIGAYSVKFKNHNLTFLDTPGHAAFANMRQRGANVTDLVVLVVAADDGVMPQTRESIKYAQNAGCPIIVAINKVDKEGANIDRIKQALMEFELTPEEWGGQTQFVQVSALKNIGIDDLLECICVQTEVMDLKANPKGQAQGVVIESRVETGRGPMATILVQSGTLNKGDYMVVGETYGRARSLMDFAGKDLKLAGPSTPVQILGLDAPPSPGDILNVVSSEREAIKIVENRINERKALASAPSADKKSSLEDFFKDAQVEGEEKKVLKLVIRSDVQGSYEAIKNSLEVLGNSEVSVQVIGGGVGPITDSDVQLCSTSKGYIIGFNMRPVTTARKMAETLGVDIKSYSIIYQLIDDVTKALEGLLEPEQIEVYLGRAEVRNTFNVPKIGVIAGSAVIDGKIQRGCQIRLLREGKIVFDGKLSSLKRFKDDVKEVQNGYECGIALENYNDVKSNDIFEAYMMEKRARKLEEVAKTAPV